MTNRLGYPRSTNRRAKIKLIKSFRGKFFDEGKIKGFPFGFLEAENICITFVNFIPNLIPFLSVIDTPSHSNTKHSRHDNPLRNKIVGQNKLDGA
jgi:hypothetical protein